MMKATKITSCWSYTKQGLMSIKKAKLNQNGKNVSKFSKIRSSIG